MSYFKKRGSSFSFAFEGVKAAFMEPNFRVQVLSAVLVLFLGFGFGITKTEWLFVILCCAGVLSLELINSAVERLCDVITSEINPNIKYIKDVCAAAVLLASLASLAVGIIIFTPYLIRLFS
jgi:diacylglycerol kinase